MAPVLDDLLNDGRLARLFSKDSQDCALQLWILQMKDEDQSIENRVVYGRLVPYSHSSDSWSATDNNSFQPFGSVQAQVIRLNLYLKSVHCVALLRGLTAGKTVSEISEELQFGLSDRLNERFGTTALGTESLLFRPVACQLNRDAHVLRSPSSPHGGAGAFSASITQADKGALFRLGPDYSVALTAYVIKQLNDDTGLNFGGNDTVRFGDLELLVFPALDDKERRLLSVGWGNEPRTLIARFNPMQVPHFNGFQFRLSIANDGQVVYAGIATAERDTEGVFECRFELGTQLHAITDSTELEVFGFHGADSRGGTLCCRWRINYIREIHLQGHLVNGGAGPVRFDWLEKTIRPSASGRVKAALTLNRGNLGFENRVGEREVDPWVPANRDLASLFERLHPPKSEGRFFLQWGLGDNVGRLNFVEWFRALLAKHKQHQVIIFDPYFDQAGLGLLLLCAPQGADCLVFTALPKPKEEDAELSETQKRAVERARNLAESCEKNRHLMGQLNLRIFGLKAGRLHDRYILITAPDRLPVAGFNLSNSLESAAENYPLLVTPIPADVLLQVDEYKTGLVREAHAAQPGGETENPVIRLLFDSSAPLPTPPRRHDFLGFLEKTNAGDVLSAWTGESSLQGLHGGPLKERVAALHLVKDESLSLPEATDLGEFLDRQGGDFSDFSGTWDVLGEILANSRAEDKRFRQVESEHGFLEFLASYLEASFRRTYAGPNKMLATSDPRFFRNPVETLLHSSYHPHHWFHATKYAALTWAEYYTIKFLWWYAPAFLLAITEARAAAVPAEPQEADAMPLSLLSQAASEISLSVQLDISDLQRDLLVRSSNGLLQWMGLNAIERQLEKSGGLARVLELVGEFSYPERIQALGWMVHHAARDPKTTETFKGLVAALHDALPASIPADELRPLVDSMRGHMRQLAWAESWLFQDVISPLIQNGRCRPDDACEIWMEELATMLAPQTVDHLRMFNAAREGQTTNIAAFLFANSTPERQLASLRALKATLNLQRRIVQQPLASTSNWARWDGALLVSMWILVFSRFAEYYLRGGNTPISDLAELSQGARDLAMVKPMAEWRSAGISNETELASFLDKVEELLASRSTPDEGAE